MHRVGLACFCRTPGYYKFELDFRTSKDNRKLQAEYEKTYRKYQKEPQPKITALDVHVEIFPARRNPDDNGVAVSKQLG